MNRWTNPRRECATGGERLAAMTKSSGSCVTVRPASSDNRIALLRELFVSLPCVVRESCYPFYTNLLHGAFQWLQPRSPVERVVESGRGPDPPDVRAEAARPSAGSGRANAARVAPARLQQESRRAGRVEESLPRVARALGAN